jgi:hypothetical protein
VGLIGKIGRRVARRSQWLARRLWLIAVAEVALITYRHWRRLEAPERARLLELVRKGRGRPSKLSDSEARELEQLLEKLGHAELAGDIARTVLPFRPFGRLAEWIVGRFGRSKRKGRRDTTARQPLSLRHAQAREDASAAAAGDGGPGRVRGRAHAR